jgi:hypothetical protein
MPFGIIDTTYVDLPAGIDDAYIRGLQTRSGLDFADMIQAVDAAMAAVNDGADPLVGALTFRTPNETGAVRGIGSKRVQRAGEYTFGRPQQGKRAGHMLPIGKWEVTTGFTEDGLDAITMEAFNQEMDDIVLAYQRFYLAEVLTRLFDPAEVQVDEGTNVLSPGFAGSGTGANVFSGTYPDGNALPGGYTHYAFTTIANLATAIATYTARLAKWHSAPFDMIGSESAIALVAALPTFVSSGSALVRPGINTAEALVDAELYLGVLNGNIRVRHAEEGVGATSHLSIFKTYGDFDARNPLAWRWDPLKGQDAYVRSREIYPLAGAMAIQWLGFGVNDRAGAVNIFIDNAAVAYVAPTITLV